MTGVPPAHTLTEQFEKQLHQTNVKYAFELRDFFWWVHGDNLFYRLVVCSCHIDKVRNLKVPEVSPVLRLIDVDECVNGTFSGRNGNSAAFDCCFFAADVS